MGNLKTVMGLYLPEELIEEKQAHVFDCLCNMMHEEGATKVPIVFEFITTKK
jgi:hypothetical protein